VPQHRFLKPGKIETDQGYEKSVRKVIPRPPQVHEVSNGRGAEQHERNAESDGSKQEKILAEAGCLPFS
jgi:hypothetical protein